MPESGNEAWRRKVPWWIDEAIVVVGDLLRPGFRVFEWGTGASTIWLARRVATVISVDNDEEWCRRVRVVLAEEGMRNVELRFLRDDAYFQAIREYEPFDAVVVDGRMRADCIREAQPKVEAGGLLILDDSQRSHYQPGIDLLAGWSRIDISNDKRSLSIFRK